MARKTLIGLLAIVSVFSLPFNTFASATLDFGNVLNPTNGVASTSIAFPTCATGEQLHVFGLTRQSESNGIWPVAVGVADETYKTIEKIYDQSSTLNNSESAHFDFWTDTDGTQVFYLYTLNSSVNTHVWSSCQIPPTTSGGSSGTTTIEATVNATDITPISDSMQLFFGFLLFFIVFYTSIFIYKRNLK